MQWAQDASASAVPCFSPAYCPPCTSDSGGCHTVKQAAVGRIDLQIGLDCRYQPCSPKNICHMGDPLPCRVTCGLVSPSS